LRFEDMFDDSSSKAEEVEDHQQTVLPNMNFENYLRKKVENIEEHDLVPGKKENKCRKSYTDEN
jgi:hypothetical protein